MSPSDAQTPVEKQYDRLSINVSPITSQTLRELAAAKGTTITEVIRQSVAVLKVLEEEQAEGAQVHLVRPGATPMRLRLL
ncbi:hypothetical protein [Jidongwangia harbinensis]|uniref:hypothetical protein n=1 Tax=Jidongwangia harbinensis TaxID=2878561 RepID=UPI001CD9FBEA|nr:hypothetical protein [Jidongwangia harbinensis]MCA2213009.1 hypothetical protein [Jidongwangia harbinensis]